MKKNSSVKALEHKANKGDINALFQLAEYYAQGQFVTQDVEKALLHLQKHYPDYDHYLINVLEVSQEFINKFDC